jgi:hypothetical protein
MKKFVIAAIAAIFAVTSFVGCTVSADAADIVLEKADVDLTKAKVGYGLKIKMGDDGETPVTPLEITASGYSQAAIELPYMGFKTAEVTLTTTGKTTVGFLAKGASSWDGRIDGGDEYWDDAITTKTTKTIAIPDGAAFITFGSNGTDDVIIIDSIVLK